MTRKSENRSVKNIDNRFVENGVGLRYRLKGETEFKQIELLKKQVDDEKAQREKSRA